MSESPLPSDTAESMPAAQTLAQLQAHCAALEEQLRQCQMALQQATALQADNACPAAPEPQGMWSAIFDPLPEMVMVYDASLRFRFVNTRVQECYGLSASAMLGKTHAELLLTNLPSSDQDLYQDLYQDLLRRAVERRSPQFGEVRLALPAQLQVGVFSARCIPIVDDRGEVLEVVAILHDVSDRRWLETALQAEENRFLAMFQNASVPMALSDLNGYVITANEADCRFLGYPLEELVGMHYHDFTPPEDWSLDDALFQELIAGKRDSYVIHKRYRRKDGAIVWGRLTVCLMRDRQQRRQGVIILCEDITPQKQAEAERQQAEVALQQHAQREQVISKIATTVRQTLDLNEVYTVAATEIAAALAADVVALVKYLPQQGIWKHVAEFRRSPQFPSKIGIEIPDADNPLAAQLKQLQVVQLEDTRAVGDAVNRAIATTFPGSWLLVPVVVGGKVWGSLSLLRLGRATTWTPDIVDLASGVADQLGVLLRQADLYQQVQIELAAKQQTTEALRASEQRFRSIFEASPLGIALIDLNGRLLQVNPSLCAMLGYSEAELLNRSIFEVTHPDDRSEESRLFAAALNNEVVSIKREKRYLRKDGSSFWGSLTATTIRDQDGNILTGVGMVEDISDRKRVEAERLQAEQELYQAQQALLAMNQELEQRVQERTAQLETVNLQLMQEVQQHRQTEQALRVSQERLRLAVEAAHMGVWEIDLKTGIERWSAESQQLFGFTPGSFDGQFATFLNQVHPDDRAFVVQHYEQAIQQGHYACDFRIIRPDGTLRWLSTLGQVIYGDNHDPLRMVGVDFDITDRKHAEEQLRTSLREKEMLLQEIHHRVKNNLQMISSLLRLQTATVQDAVAIRLLQESQNRIKAMALVHEKLYASRDFAQIDFAEYIRSLLNHIQHSYLSTATAIALTLEIPSMPLLADDVIACGLIVHELVSNAIKHAFSELSLESWQDVHPEIKVKFFRTSTGHATLSVSDNGIGIPSHVDIFNTGSLGLQIVNALTQQLRGTLQVERQPGTTFTLTFMPRRSNGHSPCP